MNFDGAFYIFHFAFASGLYSKKNRQFLAGPLNLPYENLQTTSALTIFLLPISYSSHWFHHY
jgi:hypothetical protein